MHTLTPGVETVAGHHVLINTDGPYASVYRYGASDGLTVRQDLCTDADWVTVGLYCAGLLEPEDISPNG
jgi:hypothetical protein